MKWTPNLCLSLLLLAALPAYADIYRYLDDEGVECFTDTPREDAHAVKIMKEFQGPVKNTRKIPTPKSYHSLVNPLIHKQDQPEFTTGEPDNCRILPVSGRITSTTGFRNDPLDGKLRHHNGIDIAIPQGTLVKPVAGGVVVFSGFRPGYGNMVVVDHQNGIITLYAHNSANKVREGELVEKGTIIALTGSTGRSTGPHLHFEAWQNGTNITATFTPDGGSSPTTTASTVRNDHIRRMVQTDGTIRFTNWD